jgi:hypothetical protein
MNFICKCIFWSDDNDERITEEEEKLTSDDQSNELTDLQSVC